MRASSSKVHKRHASADSASEKKNRIFATCIQEKTPRTRIHSLFSPQSRKRMGLYERYAVSAHTKIRLHQGQTLKKGTFWVHPSSKIRKATRAPKARTEIPTFRGLYRGKNMKTDTDSLHQIENLRILWTLLCTCAHENQSSPKSLYWKKYTRKSSLFSPPRRKAWGLTNVALSVRTRKSNFTKIATSKKALFERAASSKVDKSNASAESANDERRVQKFSMFEVTKPVKYLLKLTVLLLRGEGGGRVRNQTGFFGLEWSKSTFHVDSCSIALTFIWGGGLLDPYQISV